MPGPAVPALAVGIRLVDNAATPVAELYALALLPGPAIEVKYGDLDALAAPVRDPVLLVVAQLLVDDLGAVIRFIKF